MHEYNLAAVDDRERALQQSVDFHTNFHQYAYTWIRRLIKTLKALDTSTTLFDNAPFVFFHVIETFSKDFLEVHGLRSRGFQLLLH